ncbi:MAG: NAD-dependent epimerase/dehydratase family protein [Proteobacteria bacterium]|nr:NAD-dependent epimerase/dehydratase family protein [Pseudomonadota bacterium]
MMEYNLTDSKTWLVTGVAGFIGSNLLENLLKLNQKVVGLDNFFSGHTRNLDEVQKLVTPDQWNRFNFMEGDIRDENTCKKACESVGIVLHQAALGSVPLSVENPGLANDINVKGFVNMLSASKDAGVKRFVYASSSAVYGDSDHLPATETIIGRSISPYATTKYINELYADVFAITYGMKCIGLRYFNVFGPRQDPNGAYAAVIPQWFSDLLTNKTVNINGDGKTTRDFCYIDNCVQANLLAGLADNPDAVNQVYNVSLGLETSLNDLFYIIRDRVEPYNPEVSTAAPAYRDFRSGDIRFSYADISKTSKLLGYAPEYSVLEGLQKAAQWYFDFL